MSKARILVVDDKEMMVKLLVRLLSGDYLVVTARSGAEALAALATEDFDVVLTDIRMPGADGFEVLRAVKRDSPRTEVILITAFASVPSAVQAIRQGAYEYLQKPFAADDLVLVVARALERSRASRELEELPPAFHALAGRSPAMARFREALRHAATLDDPVLLTGELGSGKRTGARAIHEASSRAHGALVVVGCAALPPARCERELFGAADAPDPHVGAWERSGGGSLVLEEFAALPRPAQSRLATLLQQQTRRGERQARVIATSRRDLPAELAVGRLDGGLYRELRGVAIAVPALRERPEDLPELALHFLAATPTSNPPRGFEPSALDALRSYGWPGNVSELKRVIAEAAALSQGGMLGLRDLPLGVIEAGQVPTPLSGAAKDARLPYREALEQAREAASRSYLTALLREFKGNVTRAAERAGLERESLHRLLKRYGLRSEDFKEDGPS